MNSARGRGASDDHGHVVRRPRPGDGVVERAGAGWLPSDRPGHPAVPLDALSIRPPTRRLTVEAVTALSDALRTVAEPVHVLIDLREVSELDADAVAALVVLDATVKENGTSGVTIRVRTARQLEAFECVWDHVLIG